MTVYLSEGAVTNLPLSRLICYLIRGGRGLWDRPVEWRWVMVLVWVFCWWLHLMAVCVPLWAVQGARGVGWAPSGMVGWSRVHPCCHGWCRSAFAIVFLVPIVDGYLIDVFVVMVTPAQ